MHVLITGGAGHIGKVITQRLVDQGWQVRVVGIDAEVELPGAEYCQGNITDYEAIRQVMEGCEAVIHLAALPSPTMAPASKLFNINVMGTFNVFEAAASLGIKRVVQATSINVLGCVWSIEDVRPKYFPIDENHPTYTTDVYSFGKGTAEDIGEYYWRRDKISSVGFRFPWVYNPDFIATRYHPWRENVCKAIDELAAMPEAEQKARVANIHQRSMEFRVQRPLQYYPERKPPAITKFTPEDDPLLRTYTFDRFDYWNFVDVRDAAKALELAVTADYEGAHPLFLNDALNSLRYDSMTLIRLFHPNVTDIKRPLKGAESLISIDKARALIGFELEHSVQV